MLVVRRAGRVAGSLEAAGHDAGQGEGDPPGRGPTAGDALGAVMHFLDKGDYPLPDNEEMLLELAELMRATAPDVILTHAKADPYNYDHPVAADLTIRARAVAQALGRESEYPPLGAPPVFRFEPHQPEMCEFKPDVLVDITPVFNRKTAAMAAMASRSIWSATTARWPSGARCRRCATVARRASATPRPISGSSRR